MSCPRLCLSALTLFLFATPVWADVSVEVPGGANILGSLVPAGDADTFTFDAVAGTELALKLSVRQKADLAFMPTITGPDAMALDPMMDAGTYNDTGKKLTIAKLPLEMTGTYTVRVAAVGTGTGEYKLSLRTKAPKSFQMLVRGVAAGNTETVAFAAPGQATVSLTATSPKGGAAVPRFGMFCGMDLSDAPKAGKTSHKVKKLVCDPGGDLDLEVTNSGTADGDIDVRVSIKAPKQKPITLDVRDETLGFPNGGGTFVGALIDGALGGTVTVDDVDSTIAGADISVPAGAFDGTLLVSIATATADGIADNTQQSAGQTLSLGPAGAAFDMPVTVTLPYDATRLPVDATDGDVLVQRVSKVGKKDAADTLTPTDVDDMTQTATVEVTGFSRLTPVSPAGSPRLGGRAYWLFGQEVELVPGSPSTTRVVAQVNGEVLFDGGGLSGTFEFSGTELESVSSHDPNSGVGSVGTSANPVDEGGVAGTWSYLPDRQRISIEVGMRDPDTYWVGADGSALVAAVKMDSDETQLRLEMLIEKSPSLPTLEELAGNYQVYDYRHEVAETFGPLQMAGANSSGVMKLLADGTFTLQLAEREVFFEGGNAFDREVANGPIAGSWSVELDGSLLFEFIDLEDGGGAEIERFFPDIHRSLILGSVSQAGLIQGEGLFAMAALVRQSSGHSVTDLQGDHLYIRQEMLYETAQAGGSIVPDYVAKLVQDVLAFDGTNSMNSTQWYDRNVSRNDQAAGGVLVEDDVLQDFPPTFGFSSGGIISLYGKSGFVAAFTPTGIFAFGIEAPQSKSDAAMANVYLKLPPKVSGR